MYISFVYYLRFSMDAVQMILHFAAKAKSLSADGAVINRCVNVVSVAVVECPCAVVGERLRAVAALVDLRYVMHSSVVILPLSVRVECFRAAVAGKPRAVRQRVDFQSSSAKERFATHFAHVLSVVRVHVLV